MSSCRSALLAASLLLLLLGAAQGVAVAPAGAPEAADKPAASPAAKPPVPSEPLLPQRQKATPPSAAPLPSTASPAASSPSMKAAMATGAPLPAAAAAAPQSSPAPQAPSPAPAGTPLPAAQAGATPAPGPKLGNAVMPAKHSGSIQLAVLAPLLPKCSKDEDCVAVAGKHSACRDYWCACEDGAKYDGAFSKKCLLTRTAVGQECKENGDCRTPNSYCKVNRCQCMSKFVFSDDGSRCLPEATEESPTCEEARQCVRLLHSDAGLDGPAVCLNGHCRCRYDYEHINATCVPKQSRGHKCTTDSECDFENGSCVQGVCGCKDGFVPDGVAANKCLPVAHNMSTACSEDSQCSEGLGDLSRCNAGRCVCVEGAAFDGKACNCSPGEELDKDKMRCEKATASRQSAIKQGDDRGAASSLAPASLTCLLVALYSWMLLSSSSL